MMREPLDVARRDKNAITKLTIPSKHRRFETTQTELFSDLCLGLLHVPLRLEVCGRKPNLYFMAATNRPTMGNMSFILSHKETFTA